MQLIARNSDATDAVEEDATDVCQWRVGLKNIQVKNT